MYRKTFVEVNLENIKKNVSKVVDDYDYDYYFGVVKANCYNHGLEAVESIIAGGCNYLAVSSLDEAVALRNLHKEIPILCLEPISVEFLNVCYDNDITITVTSLEYLKMVNFDLKMHLKIDTGMNRLGVKSKEELIMIRNYCDNNSIVFEGVFSHIYEASDVTKTLAQFELFEKMIGIFDNIKIIHLAQSDTILKYDKLKCVNGCRLGLIMYGLVGNDFFDTFKLSSEVIEIKKVFKGETIGYNGNYICENDCLIGVIPIGYADGIIRKNTGRYVYINNKKFFIVGNICMDLMMIKIDDSIKVGDEVLIIRDNNHINYIAQFLETISYEVLTSITSRVDIRYKKKHS